jgi:acyl carrier protein
MVFPSQAANGGRLLCPICQAPVPVKRERILSMTFCTNCGRYLWCFQIGGEARLYDPDAIPAPKRAKIDALVTRFQDGQFDLAVVGPQDSCLDSLDIVEFVMEMEEMLDLQIRAEDAAQLKSLKDVIDYVERRIFDSDD